MIKEVREGLPDIKEIQKGLPTFIPKTEVKKFRRGEWRAIRDFKKLGYTPIAHGKGWPDLMLRKGKKLLFVEVKSGDQKTSKHQNAVLKALKGAGLEAKIFRYRRGKTSLEEP